MYLDVIPQPGPVPSVRGLGAVRIPVPRMVRGMGQATQTGCMEADFTTYMNSWLGSLRAEPAEDAILGCGSDYLEYCTDPATAAQQQVQAAVENYCSVQNDASIFGCPVDPGCNSPSALAASFVPTAQAFFASLPSSVWSVGGQEYSPGQNPSGSPAVVQPSVQPVSSSPFQSGGSTPISVTLQNVSRPGQPFWVGDQFNVVVSGPAGAAVTASSSQNGSGMSGATPYGSIPSSGPLTISGTMGASDIGSWVENWMMNGSPAGTLNFSVSAVPSSPTPSVPVSSSPAIVPATSSTPVLGALPSWLTSDVNLFGQDIPVWGLGLGAVALLFLFGGRK